MLVMLRKIRWSGRRWRRLRGTWGRFMLLLIMPGVWVRGLFIWRLWNGFGIKLSWILKLYKTPDSSHFCIVCVEFTGLTGSVWHADYRLCCLPIMFFHCIENVRRVWLSILYVLSWGTIGYWFLRLPDPAQRHILSVLVIIPRKLLWFVQQHVFKLN